MSTKIINFVLFALIGTSILAGIFLYPLLPAEISSHWNTTGEANGSLPKFLGVFLLPLIMIGLFLLRLIILRTDPFKENIASFKAYHDGFWIILFLFFWYLFGLILAWNLGQRFNFTTMLIPAISILFYAIGIVMEHSKRNWFLGIRTPWTLSSDLIWDKTHTLGGKLFKIAAALSVLGILTQSAITRMLLLIAPLLIASLMTVIYSYVEYSKLPSRRP